MTIIAATAGAQNNTFTDGRNENQMNRALLAAALLCGVNSAALPGFVDDTDLTPQIEACKDRADDAYDVCMKPATQFGAMDKCERAKTRADAACEHIADTRPLPSPSVMSSDEIDAPARAAAPPSPVGHTGATTPSSAVTQVDLNGAPLFTPPPPPPVGHIEVTIPSPAVTQVDFSGRPLGEIQAVVATRSLLADRRNRSSASAGVFQSSVFRGRELRAAATAAISLALCMLRSVPFGEVLAQKSVCVLVGAALPWAVRIAEMNSHARLDLEARVLGHLSSP